jgi:class 3 adenylate cyclase
MMKCAACNHENREGAKFCEECATPLARLCAGCGAELRPTAKFCDECGAPTAGSTPQPKRPAQTAAGARKVVTIVFADLIGSTALHERVDAESARRLMERYYDALRAAVEEHGGTVVKLLGDGVMAAFGVPQVAEDDAVRAVRAGVAMQDAFRALLSDQVASLGEVGLRVAVNTGEVVVSGTNDDVVGDPVNIAARLQQEARDGDVVIGEATQRLVSTLVTLAPKR